MSILDTNSLKKHILSEYAKVTPLMEYDGISMQLNTSFRKNTFHDTQGEFCFTDNDVYHFVVLERGKLYRDDITKSIFEITYWAIKGEISEASAIYEAKNRIQNQDFRRIMFTRRLQYFESIGPEYAQCARSEIDIILSKAPYQD
jgi:hypothetical protein